MEETALIYNIQPYSLHDGPGIRTVVFFKGCPLRCLWCCNPESQKFAPEISYVKRKCIGQKACGACEKSCPYQAVSFDADTRAYINREHCTECLQCARVCPSAAIRVEGVEMKVSEILDIVEKDSVFYRHGGGLTVSGGEPLAQSPFLIELLREAQKRRLDTAIETCGFAQYAVLQAAARFLDTIIFDIKSINNEKHVRYTGQSNRIILDNFLKLCADYPQLPKLVRTPVIPGFNDLPADREDILSFIAGKPNVTHEALPYHRFGVGKYAALGRKYYQSSKH